MAHQTRGRTREPVIAAEHATAGRRTTAALLRGVNEIARSLVPYHPTESSLTKLARGARELLEPDGLAVLLRRAGSEYVFEVTDGVLSEWDHYVLSGGSSELLGALFERDEVVLFHRSQSSPWCREFLYAAGMEWGALAPIRAQGQSIGAVLLNHGTRMRFHPEHAGALMNLATLAGVAVLEDRQRGHLEDLFMSVIVSLTMALEAKDPYTEGHSVRVAAYSEAIGKQLGLPPEKLDLIHRSCLLHDIGKIAVDETILQKVGSLDPVEREKMDLHPLIGERILRPITLLHPLLPSVRSHHEHYDGTGYPDGLSGAAIPIEARIIAVADAFDAMTSTRPYRAALPEEDAMEELRRQAGVHFDPRVVAAFERIYPAVRRTLEHLRPRAAPVNELE